ncbi:septum formation family protein [Catellatospora bangladeshensis]|uniref:Septum formation-related domain-containing protein n=1 Tax=Catellatospora bangladeshensis TaxID=310355 RepID=A0A8J3JAS3_9ACTN|nr:septum formation family protein [Catellatospora bangladeshensis]GIF81392.1 hypothetical protein Cba03nite_27410 [Catellatospora bangladeshensis]
MRVRLTAGAMTVTLLTSLAMAGCAAKLPAAVDRDLTDDWVKVAQVEGYVPDAGVCLDVVPKGTGRYTDLTVDCSKLHYTETVHVGRFAETATRGAKDFAAAFTECDAKSKEYIGRPWSDGTLVLKVTTPTDAAWKGGARWFRCDLTEVDSVSGGSNWVRRSASLKDGIPAASLLTCGKYNRKANNTMPRVACTTAHNAEFAGSFRAAANVAFPKSERQWDVIHKQCRAVVGRFLGVSATTAQRWGVVSYHLGEDGWADGNRLVRCYVWFGGSTMKKSAKGSKGKGLPNFVSVS